MHDPALICRDFSVHEPGRGAYPGKGTAGSCWRSQDLFGAAANGNATATIALTMPNGTTPPQRSYTLTLSIPEMAPLRKATSQQL